jgi:hypothetical protein
MTGKKKSMDGGIFGSSPGYENKTINDIAHKIINGKKKENKIKAFNWINSNYLRAEQRIKAFFQKLEEELYNKKKNITKERVEELFNYFKKVIETYPDKIESIVNDEVLYAHNNDKRKIKYDRDFFKAYFYFYQNKLDTDFKALQDIFKKLKITIIPPKKNSVSVPLINSENPNSKITNNKKLEEFNTIYEELIEEFDDWIRREFFKNFRNNKPITISVEEKNDLFIYIMDLANRIYDFGKMYSLPEYRNNEKLNILKGKLATLIKLYKTVFITSTIPINRGKESHANKYTLKNINLDKKLSNLSIN